MTISKKKRLFKTGILLVLLIACIGISRTCAGELQKYDLPLTYKTGCVNCKTIIADRSYCSFCGKDDIVLYHNKYCETCNSISVRNATYCESCGETLGTKLSIDELGEDFNYIKRIKTISIINFVIACVIYLHLIAYTIEFFAFLEKKFMRTYPGCSFNRV